MPADSNPSRKPQLSVRLGSTWLTALLRVDLIRHHTLLGLVGQWNDDDETRDDVINQLDALAEAMRSPREGELDLLVEQIEDAAAMDDAEISITLADTLRLRDELNVAIKELSRFNPNLLARLPEQGRRAS